MPIRLLRQYAGMYRRLVAEDALLGVRVAAVGSGALRREDANAAIREWTEAASEGRPAVRATSPQALAAMLAGSGIALHVKRKGDG